MYFYAAGFVFEHVFHTTITTEFQAPLGFGILKHPVTRQLACHRVNHRLSSEGGMAFNAVERYLVMQSFRFSSFNAVPGVLGSQ